MKKCLSILVLLSMLILLASCKNVSDNKTQENFSDTLNSTAPTTKPASTKETIKVFEIVDLEKRDNIPCDQAFQKFYSDAEYNYFYHCIKSEYVLVKYSDGTEKTAEDALKNGDITIADLDKYNISYIKQAK